MSFAALCVVVANMAFFVGIAAMPLGEATAIFFVAPLFITALSVPFLGERVGIRRWISVAHAATSCASRQYLCSLRGARVQYGQVSSGLCAA